jgi:hypothetical protein
MTAVVFSELGEDEEPHLDLVDLVKWDDPPTDGQTFTRAIANEIQQGVLDKFRNQKPIPSFMFVDDSALIAIQKYLRLLLNAMIEAIYLLSWDEETTLGDNAI